MPILLQALNLKRLHKRCCRQIKQISLKPIRYYSFAHKLPTVQKAAVLHDSAVVLVDAASIADSIKTNGKLTFHDVHTILSIISSVGGCSLVGELCVVTLTITCMIWAARLNKRR
jgi:hypothetical protein